MDNKVKFLRGTATEYEASTKDNDTFYYTTDTKKLYLGKTEITGIEIDDTSTTATNKTWSAKKISDSIPTTLPANGGDADTVDGKHASDFAQIISFEDTPTDTKTAIGIQGKTTTYWCSAWTDYPATLQDGQGMIIAVNYKSYGTSVGVDNIWCRQIYITPHNSKIYQRLISATTVEEWASISNLGYHFSDRTQITSGDLNTITTQGQFVVLQSTAEDTLANQPWTVSGYYLDVYRRSPNAITQIALRWNGKIASRYLDGNTWSDWVNIADGGNAATVGGRSITVTDVDPGAGSALGTGEIVFVTEVT